MGDRQGRRRRSSSLLIYKEPLESPERLSDQAVLPNLNATWVNAKGASRPPTGRETPPRCQIGTRAR